MKKAKLWSHGHLGMVEHGEIEKQLGSPAFVRAENYEFLMKKTVNLEAENARLKAEVERLTKAGDAMAINTYLMLSDEVYDSDLMKFVRSWNAAKEGKDQP